MVKTKSVSARIPLDKKARLLQIAKQHPQGLRGIIETLADHLTIENGGALHLTDAPENRKEGVLTPLKPPLPSSSQPIDASEAVDLAATLAAKAAALGFTRYFATRPGGPGELDVTDYTCEAKTPDGWVSLRITAHRRQQ